MIRHALAALALLVAYLLAGCASVTPEQIAQVRAAAPKIAAAAPARWWDPGWGRAEPWTCTQATQRLWFAARLHEPEMVQHVRQQERAYACATDPTR